MKFKDILSIIGHLPATENKNGKILFDFVIENNIRDILEIGFFHGKSANFMAAALDEGKAGKIVTIDLTDAVSYKPNILELSKETGLSEYIEPVFSPIGSQWEMRNLIKSATIDGICQPSFDLCFIDAYHSWETAGMDFFLAEKLIRPGGWIIMDDLSWSFDSSPTWRNLPETQKMPLEFRTATQVGDVFDFLVRQHPSFHNFEVINNWGIAQKKVL